TDDPLETTAAWNREVQDPEELSTVLDRWLAYYEEQSIEKISYGALVLRRRTGDNWVRTAEAPRSGINRAGPHLERLFSAQDLLRDRDDESLLSHRFRFHESARLTHGLRPRSAGWSLESAELSLDTGLGFRAGLDEATGEIAVRLDPALPLEEVLAAAAQALGVDAERLQTVGVGLVRQLIEFGYVIPADE
ncbi:MAG: hypothetical protein M3P42_01030, partial [Actinomycetota bacterium]|nr:hypothetical protein [Actinomycetota bacterium]